MINQYHTATKPSALSPPTPSLGILALLYRQIQELPAYDSVLKASLLRYLPVTWKVRASTVTYFGQLANFSELPHRREINLSRLHFDKLYNKRLVTTDQENQP